MGKVGDVAFKVFSAGLGVATIYLTATFSVNVYRGYSWHRAQSVCCSTPLSLSLSLSLCRSAHSVCLFALVFSRILDYCFHFYLNVEVLEAADSLLNLSCMVLFFEIG
ncbi:hypothetical protein AMTR_s00055p00198430 [Amborella trichopoda]|uniref:Uncharacterized protein n=1 Tax=Amborella trichopoda TaxID=13333 RepID=U5DA91_AMBTC|nr:hypothetical protein AMTR_s00055p00198430 [Amborella trichopoda]